ncbi:protein HEG homolog 1 isoform X2 [Sciurus carolinensis]|uniref:protein HEG homolog 1 isoform X2 n=1 Tax=Sciurus carolinensis TaxID=30640 RepID=UPI001FB1FF38|nr:protein HEG homolog 1 isoform X2 [Sciurus carolinensis]
MASPRASRWPPPPLLLFLPPLLLLLLPPPAAPWTPGQPPSPARPALLSSVRPARPPDLGREREALPLPPPQKRREPAPLGPSHTAPAPGAATPRGRFGWAPRVGSAATISNHWPESNTEPHIENIVFYQNQEDFSTVDSKEGTMVQTSRMSQVFSEAPVNLSPLIETATVEGRNKSSSRTNFTILPIGHSSEIATTITSQGSTLSLERLHLPSSSSGSEGRTAPSQMESRIPQVSLGKVKGLPEEVAVHSQVTGTSDSSWSSLAASEPGEPTMLSRKRNSLGPELSLLHISKTISYSPPSDHSSTSGSIKELNNSTALQRPLVNQTKSTHVATTFTDSVSRILRSLTISLGPINKTEDLPTDSKIATTSVSVSSSPSAVESRSNRRATKTPEDGELIEPSTENESGVTSLHWQKDSTTFRGHQLALSSEMRNGSFMPQTETVSRSVPSIRDEESTAHWSLTNSKTFADVTGSSASHPRFMNSLVLTQSSDSAQQSRGGNTVLDENSYSESSSTSSSESLDSSTPQGEHSTLEDDAAPASRSRSSLAEGSTSGAHSRGAHTWAALTGSGERTLRSLSLADATSAEVGSSAGATQRGNVTDHAGLLSRSPGAAPALGVTGLSYGQVSGTDTEQRTSSDHTDHTYVSSTFTKGERALLSITDNGSSSDISESSTSYIKISDSPYSDYSSSSHAQTERRNISSYNGEYVQPSTESLTLHTSSLPSYTSTINILKTLVLMDASTESVGDSSSASGPSLPLPSVSQSHQLFSSSLLSTKASTHQLKSTSEASTLLSSSPSPLPVSSTAASPVPLSVSQTTLPHSSTPVLPREGEMPESSVQTSTMVSSMIIPHSSNTADPKNQSIPQQEKIITEAKSPTLVSLPTESTKDVTVSAPSGVPLPPALTESFTKSALPAMSTSLAQMSPTLTTTTLKASHSSVTTPSTLSSTEVLSTDPIAVHTTTGKQLFPTNPEILVPQISTEGAITTERNRVHIDATTHLITLTNVPTSTKELTTRLDITEEYSPASHFLRTSPFQTTDVSTAEVLTPKPTTFATQSSTQSPMASSPPPSVNSCAMNPCLHDGKCVVDLTSGGYRCMCSPSWQGDNCSVDVNECLSNPCPPLAICNNTQGSFTCKCPVGYQLEKGICNLVRTFVTEFKLKKTFFNATVEKHSDLLEVENEITETLNVCFSTLPGYIRSTVHASWESSMVVISLQTTFSLTSNVTLFDLADGIQKCVNSCRSSAEVCQLLGSQRRIFRAGSLCKRKSPECDKETSICTDLDGIALCQCKSGYFQFNKMDHSCRACEDGYRLENETCMSCPFGLGGLNCGNPYQLITVVIAAAGGGLLLILGIALIVTCCRKNKNDISKLIFKSGDFQMSPYAEYPKNPRSQEWGREAIEMHENGSTKNLLQMTDVYYSPTSIRNPELERNGLYPAYTGLPGSRHSCIFPGQYNPSFISDESRRRDYF